MYARREAENSRMDRYHMHHMHHMHEEFDEDDRHMPEFETNMIPQSVRSQVYQDLKKPKKNRR